MQRKYPWKLSCSFEVLTLGLPGIFDFLAMMLVFWVISRNKLELHPSNNLILIALLDLEHVDNLNVHTFDSCGRHEYVFRNDANRILRPPRPGIMVELTNHSLWQLKDSSIWISVHKTGIGDEATSLTDRVNMWPTKMKILFAAFEGGGYPSPSERELIRSVIGSKGK